MAVGTTSVRSLESAARDGVLKPFSGDTDIFIFPGRPFHVVDCLVTNFHLPESTLLMLVSAFAGYPETMVAYQAAIANDRTLVVPTATTRPPRALHAATASTTSWLTSSHSLCIWWSSMLSTRTG